MAKTKPPLASNLESGVSVNGNKYPKIRPNKAIKRDMSIASSIVMPTTPTSDTQKLPNTTKSYI